MKIAIVGATGNVAGAAASKLADAGAEVIALVRHPEKLTNANARAQVEQGVLEDRDYVVRATRGVDALLWLTPTTLSPPDFRAYTIGLAENAVHAIGENGIQRVVFISSHGAQREGLGHVSFAGEVEKLLEAAAPNTVSLRSAGLMENLLSSIEPLKGGQLFGVLSPDKKYPLVAARDVGEVAARWLLDTRWLGHQTRGVHGAADLTAREQVDTISARPRRTGAVPPDTRRGSARRVLETRRQCLGGAELLRDVLWLRAARLRASRIAHR